MNIGIKLLILVFLICDFRNFFKFKSLISVNENYIFYVYSAIVTILALGPTILWTVLSNSDEKCYGFSSKEILNFNSNNDKLATFVERSFRVIIYATIALALDCINLMTGLLFWTIIKISKNTSVIWRVFNDEKLCKNRIKIEFGDALKRRDSKKIEFIVKTLLDEYIKILKSSNQKKTKEYEEFLGELFEKIDRVFKENFNEKDKKKFKFVFTEMDLIFDVICDEIKLHTAIQCFMPLYNKFEKKLIEENRYEILKRNIEKIEVCSKQKFLNEYLKYPFEKYIINEKELKEFEKERFIYEYFKAIINNNEITKVLKYKKLKSIMVNLIKFCENEEFLKLKMKIVIRIFKYFVLQYTDADLRNDIFLMILEPLMRRKLGHRDVFLKLIFVIYIFIYYYVFFEKKYIDNKHISELNGLMTFASDDDIGIPKLSLKFVLYSSFQDINLNGWNLIDDFEELFDYPCYFPKTINSKNILWNDKFVIEFIFLNYLLDVPNSRRYGEKFLKPYQLINNWEFKSANFKRKILKTLINAFEENSEEIGTYKLKEQQLNNITELGLWVGKKFRNYKNIFNSIFNNINNEMQKVNLYYSENRKLNSNLAELNEILKNNLNQIKGIWKFEESLVSLVGSKENIVIDIMPEIVTCEADDFESMAVERVVSEVKQNLNYAIEQTFKEIELKFDLDGIKKLNKALSMAEYDSYSNLSIEDSRWNNNIKKEEEYIEFNSVLKEMNQIEMNNFYSSIIFKKSNLKFFANIVNLKLTEINKQDAEKFLLEYELAEGRYLFKDAYYYSKDDFVNVIKESYKKIEIRFELDFIVNKDSGIFIKN